MEMTVEWCSHCGHDVEIPADKVSKCPNCGEGIRPCIDCDKHNECDWRADGYCLAFPDFRY